MTEFEKPLRKEAEERVTQKTVTESKKKKKKGVINESNLQQEQGGCKIPKGHQIQ